MDETHVTTDDELRAALGISATNAAHAILREHQRQETIAPNDVVDEACSRCYIFDEGWPCNAVVVALAWVRR